VQWVLGSFLTGAEVGGLVKLTSHLHVVQRLRRGESVPLAVLPCMLSWHAQGQLYLLRDVGREDERWMDLAQVCSQAVDFGNDNVGCVSYTNIVLNNTYSH
jgi:hypothetical protein